MKKFLAIILALVMALSLMACGGSPAQNPGGDEAETPVVTDGAALGEGAHSFTLEITDAEGKTITATINTDEETVGAALLKLNIVQGEKGLYSTVNGVTYDYNADHAYWAFYVDGEYAQAGLDDTEIIDGAVYKLAVETVTQ